jgi:Predicted methyltransferases
MGKLYVVGTPIGNLKDITFRAIEVLQSVNFIACEDTRRTSILLNHYKIEGKKLLSYYEPKESVQVPKIIKLLEKEDVALVTDAGMPSISDPGYKLIRACIEKGIPVEVIPGPSAVLTALVGSGLPTDRFTFVGFLPKKGLNNFLEELKAYKDSTIIAFESPNRVLKSWKP